MSFKKTLRNILAGGLVGLAALVGSAQKADGAIVSFNPDQSTLTDRPIYGMSQATDDFYLTGNSDTFKLDKNFSGNFQETAEYSNEHTMQDAASLGNDYTLHLGIDNVIYRMDNNTGNFAPFGSQGTLGSAGLNSFGLGALASENKAYSFAVNGNNEIIGKEWDLNSLLVTDTINFGVLGSQYGTPTGAEAYKLDNGNIGFLLTTKDAPSSRENYFLDFNRDGTFTGNGGLLNGAFGSLEDLTYNNGEIGLGYDSAFFGRVQTGQYQGTAIPEPTTALLFGLGALGAATIRRSRK
ncbi:hypothetical protein L21SP3_01651 [Sedimentisphaera cyanobacteriorum]|uniref:Ice-binding protein C-terminal domain-containing protein n=1 Tax=Sedimentisphaera cyanobacteriorum TaxID=1940790 RepID=A0A1Q2HQZ1_9BACT|nr:PEP-CTERM sorting domain-containing protein [Sedimentisphaera cyanobacteriorum]AQQ09832.1 hypothetical protein L21SP3_01651 [Sedimentisphaera cyanobacteriorum]